MLTADADTATQALVQTINALLTLSGSSISTDGKVKWGNVGRYTPPSRTFGGGSGGNNRSDEKTQKEHYDDLLDLAMDMLKQQIKDQIKELEKELELQKKLHDEAVERLEDELDGYKELIDQQKESLRLQAEERGYQKELAEKQKAVTDVQGRLAELEFDTSAEATAEKLRLQEQLSEAMSDLDDLQYEHGLDMQEQALDDAYNRFEQETQAQIDALDEQYEALQEDYERRIEELEDYLEKEGLIRQEAIALIEGKTQAFYNQLFAYNRTYGEYTDQELQNMIDKAGQAGTAVSTAMNGAASSTRGAGGAAKGAADEYQTLNNKMSSTWGWLQALLPYADILFLILGGKKPNLTGLWSFFSGAVNDELSQRNRPTDDKVSIAKHHVGYEAG